MFHNAGVLVPYCYCIFCALLFLLYQLRFCYNSWRAYRRLLLAPNPPPPSPHSYKSVVPAETYISWFTYSRDFYKAERPARDTLLL